MEWSKDLALGIEAVDEQHRRIMGCINALDDALHQQGPSRNEGIVNVLTDVADCTE
jgi:hemerythrin